MPLLRTQDVNQLKSLDLDFLLMEPLMGDALVEAGISPTTRTAELLVVESHHKNTGESSYDKDDADIDEELFDLEDVILSMIIEVSHRNTTIVDTRGTTPDLAARERQRVLPLRQQPTTCHTSTTNIDI
ncbi:hypothetical protein HAX54_033654 [Datura stramonium]|uniref:Uncharacterized protein n=1 Tax=Datura stramonium TaxID=4076 RepID=A0ABS8VEY3_DATST|nr:hypothetical protein [Datura stramonium]